MGLFELDRLPVPSWKCSLPPHTMTSDPHLMSPAPLLGAVEVDDACVSLAMTALAWVVPTDRADSRIGTSFLVRSSNSVSAESAMILDGVPLTWAHFPLPSCPLTPCPHAHSSATMSLGRSWVAQSVVKNVLVPPA